MLSERARPALRHGCSAALAAALIAAQAIPAAWAQKPAAPGTQPPAAAGKAPAPAMAPAAAAVPAGAAAPAPQPPTWRVALPEGAVRISDDGGEAVYHDARSAETVAGFFRQSFQGQADASCQPGKPGDDPAAVPLLTCRGTFPLEEGSGSEQVTVEVRQGKGATIVRLARVLHVPGDPPRPAQAVMVMGAAPIPALGPMGELARSIPPPAAAPGGPPQAAAPPAAPAGPSPAVEGEELRIRAERVGPILPSTKVDEPSLARLFPGFTLRRIQLEAEGETYHAYELLREGELMLTVQAEDEQTGSQPIVSVHSPEIPTTAGIRTDDTFEALAAAYKDLLCLRSAEDGAVVYCRSKAQSNISYLFDAQKVSAGPEQQVRPAELTLRRILQIDWVSPGTEEDE